MNAVLQILFAFAVSTLSLYPSAEALACGVCRDCHEGKAHPPGFRHPKDVKVHPSKREQLDRVPASVENVQESSDKSAAPRPGDSA